MISKVEEGIYRGPRLASLVPLKQLGVRTVLNLENDREVVAEDSVKASFHGMKFLNIPMSEIFRPSVTQLLIAASILNDRTLHPIYVHCKHGQDRTGYAVAGYRIDFEGWSFDSAYQEAKDNGHKWWFAPYLLFWPRSLKELIERKEANGRRALKTSAGS